MSKGITPVVATVLLITVTIAASGTLYTMVEENTNQAREQVQNTDFKLTTDSLRIENCYTEESETHLVLRNNDPEDAINASQITPLLNGSVQENYGVNPELVNPQKTFTINFSEEFGQETEIILTNGDTQVDYSCYNL